MNDIEYMDFLCKCEEFEERSRGDWMDAEMEGDYGPEECAD